MTSIGKMYFNGWGVTQNYSEALKWFNKAAENDKDEAEYYLGEMYYKGLGVPQDKAEAVKWYRLAAEQNYEEAQKVLRELGESW